jgi:hypothetical protein
MSKMDKKSKKQGIPFNSTNKPVHSIRDRLVQYHRNHKESKESFFLVDESRIFNGRTKLEVYMMYFDWMNENLKSLDPQDFYRVSLELYLDIYEYFISVSVSTNLKFISNLIE